MIYRILLAQNAFKKTQVYPWSVTGRQYQRVSFCSHSIGRKTGIWRRSRTCVPWFQGYAMNPINERLCSDSWFLERGAASKYTFPRVTKAEVCRRFFRQIRWLLPTSFLRGGPCSSLNYLLIVFHLFNFLILFTFPTYSRFVIYLPCWWHLFIFLCYLFIFFVIHSPHISPSLNLLQYKLHHPSTGPFDLSYSWDLRW